jgi:hypothetical protein
MKKETKNTKKTVVTSLKIKSGVKAGTTSIATIGIIGPIAGSNMVVGPIAG